MKHASVRISENILSPYPMVLYMHQQIASILMPIAGRDFNISSRPTSFVEFRILFLKLLARASLEYNFYIA